jgi:hypothetical protein
MTGDEFADLAAAWWLRGFDAADEVDRITREQQDQLPSLIRSLASGAPDGALSYVGISILEDVSDLVHDEGRDDPSMDVLIAAGLPPAEMLEILSGPYRHYVDRWGIRERLATTFSPAQFDASEDWDGRRDRRLMMDGDGVRLVDPSPWFRS